MVVERREAQRARSRRFAQADCSVARATPEARAGGNIRPRGVAHDPGASRRSTTIAILRRGCRPPPPESRLSLLPAGITGWRPW